MLLFYTPLIYSEQHIKNFIQALRIFAKGSLKTNDIAFENPNKMLLQLQIYWEWYHLRDGDACLTAKVPFLSQFDCFDVKWMDRCLSLSLIECEYLQCEQCKKVLLKKPPALPNSSPLWITHDISSLFRFAIFQTFWMASNSPRK